MKKIFLTIPVIVLAMASCQKENSVEDKTATKEVYTISAVAAGPQTKTTVDNGEVSVLWSASDELYVTSKENHTYASVYEIVTPGSKKADFTLKEGQTAQSGNLVAVYPATGSSLTDGKLMWTIPASQTYRAEGVATNNMVMTAQGSSLDASLTCAHETAVINIPVYAETAATLISATLSANEVIGGQWYRTVTSESVGNTTVAEGNTVKSVSLSLPDEGIAISTDLNAPTYLNFVVSGAVSSITGLKVSIETTDGDMAFLAKTSAQTIAAGKIYKYPTTKVTFNGVVSVDGGSFETLSDAKTEINAKAAGEYVTSLVMKGSTLTNSDVCSFMNAIAAHTSSTYGVDVDLKKLSNTCFNKQAAVDVYNTLGTSSYIHSAVMPMSFNPIDKNQRIRITNVNWCKRNSEMATLLMPGATSFGINYWSTTHAGFEPDLCWIVNNGASEINGATMCFVGAYAVADDCTSYSVENGVLYNSDKSQLISYPGGCTNESFTIPSSVKSFATYALYDAGHLKSIVFPDRTDLNISLKAEGASSLTCIIFKSKTAPSGSWGAPVYFDLPGSMVNGKHTIYIPSDADSTEKTKYASRLNALVKYTDEDNAYTYTINSVTYKSWWVIDDGTYTAAQLCSDAVINTLTGNVVNP